MTLLVVYKRRVRSHYELVFGADSRLSGGQSLDHAQKIFQLPRSDALFAFAGDTQYAYPLMMQMLRAIEYYPFSASRRLPLSKLKGHVLRIFQQTYGSIHSLPRGQVTPDAPDNFFLLGGFDWQTNRIRAWRLAFDPSREKFSFRPLLGDGGRSFFFTGDDRGAVSEAVQRMNSLLEDKGNDQEILDTEPLAVLTEIIRGGRYSSIGGVPQIAKAYRHLNTQLFQTLWPGRDGVAHPHVFGRPLLEGERNDLPIYDPAVGFYSNRDNTAELGSDAL